MGVRVEAVLSEPGMGIPLSEQDWTMFELPEAGSQYWHGSTGYRVDRIDEGEPPRVYLVRDPEWETALHGALPEGYRLYGGRSEKEAAWHFEVLGPQGEHLGGAARGYGPTPEQAADEAVAGALQVIGR